jgi:hypothetical protein
MYAIAREVKRDLTADKDKALSDWYDKQADEAISEIAFEGGSELDLLGAIAFNISMSMIQITEVAEKLGIEPDEDFVTFKKGCERFVEATMKKIGVVA